MNRLIRRRFLHLLAGNGPMAGVLGSPQRSLAQCAASGRPIRWIVPHAAGGGYDTFSRLLAPYLERTLGARIQIDNMPGAGGLRGAAVLSQAPPNGLTLGIFNLPGILMSALTDADALDPTTDFTLLGTIARSRQIWATSAETGFASIEEALETGRRRALVFGVNSFASLGFLSSAIPCSLLGVKAELVPGYSGSSESTLAAIRGEVDFVSLSSDVLLERIAAGDLRALLRISDDSPPELPELEGLPVLAGPDGIARGSAAEDASAVVRLTAAGRVLAAPPGLASGLGQCLAEAVCKAIGDPQLAIAAAKNKTPVDPSCAEATLREALTARADAKRLAPIYQESVARARR